jgi:hypothetical protein
MNLTEDQIAQMEALKKQAPFRIVWAMIDKETGEFTVYASTTRRDMNNAIRERHNVFSF